ncbi:MAG: rRNA (guanine527-N7)-methyltransferase [Thermoleophilales bacterium]|nr:rRNA (guanine527-N7)-methyltransferase [Thermoleophilales bacterium]
MAVIQARGGIGEKSLADTIAHSDRFVDLLPAGSLTVADLGSGGGLPALVIAVRRVDVAVTMIERRANRADLLRRAVASLGLGSRATVLNLDVDLVAERAARSFDVVTARSFSDPLTTARFVDRLLGEEGIGLISEPPENRTAQWETALASLPGLANDGLYQGIRRLIRTS